MTIRKKPFSHTLNMIGIVMAAITVLVLFLNFAFFVRFGMPASWLVRVMEHGSLEQALALAWLVLIGLFIYAED